MGNIFVEDNVFLSENELILRIKAGEYRYLETLSARYMPIIVKIARKNLGTGADFEDLVQEGVISLFSAVRSYKSGSASFHTFAVLCITRGISSAVRGNSASKRIPDKLISSIEDTDISATSPSPEKIVIERESYNDLAESIRLSLSPLEYRVLNAFLSGSSYADVSKSLSISQKSVDNALHRIRKKLKNPS